MAMQMITITQLSLSQQVFYNGRLPAAFKCQFIIPIFGKHRQQVTIFKEKYTPVMFLYNK